MRRWWFCALIGAVMMWDGATAFADNTTVVVTDKTSTDYISAIYKKINFCPGGRLDSFVFAQAYRGYVNLRRAGKLNSDKQLLTICDFSLSANTNRLWIIDLKDNKVLYNTYVAHGQGSGEEFARAFSNRENSHQSSLGFYVTGETYIGEHGESLRLNGMDKGYNDAALDRSIVLHGAAYVCNDFIRGNKRLGRSWGCPAVDASLAPEIISQVKEGTCLFIYYPDRQYQNSSCWLQQRTKPLQQNAEEQFQLRMPDQPQPAETQDVVTR